MIKKTYLLQNINPLERMKKKGITNSVILIFETLK